MRKASSHVISPRHPEEEKNVATRNEAVKWLARVLNFFEPKPIKGKYRIKPDPTVMAVVVTTSPRRLNSGIKVLAAPRDAKPSSDSMCSVLKGASFKQVSSAACLTIEIESLH